MAQEVEPEVVSAHLMALFDWFYLFWWIFQNSVWNASSDWLMNSGFLMRESAMDQSEVLVFPWRNLLELKISSSVAMFEILCNDQNQIFVRSWIHDVELSFSASLKIPFHPNFPIFLKKYFASEIHSAWLKSYRGHSGRENLKWRTIRTTGYSK